MVRQILEVQFNAPRPKARETHMVNHGAAAGLGLLLSISLCGTLGASYFAAKHFPGIYGIPRSNAVGCQARPLSCCTHSGKIKSGARVACLVEEQSWPI